MIALRERPRTEGGGAKRSDTINQFECGHAWNVPRLQQNRYDYYLLTKDPPDGACDKNQAAAERREEFHALLSEMEVASWIALVPDSRFNAATGCEALHCATISRAQPSHWPHWVATPSSNWTSSKVMPART